MKYVIAIVILIMGLGSVRDAYANLMISPTRINFDNRDRIQEVILINTGAETRTYRLGWQEKKAKSVGGYQDISIDDTAVDALSPFIRFSPRQVTLAPGERQIIKLQIRKKPGMNSPEYRSHLLFTALPPEEELNNQPQQSNEGVSFKLNLLLNYSIPVLYHPMKGNVSVNANFQELVVLENNGAELKVQLSKNGDISAFGRLEVYADIQGKQTQIGLANNISVFRELDYRYASVKIPRYAEFANQFNRVQLKYIGEKEHMGKIFFDTNISIFPANN